MKTLTDKFKQWLAALGLTLLAGSIAMPAEANHHGSRYQYKFSEVTSPNDPTFTQLLGVNSHGAIAGYFGSGADAAHPNKGFTLMLPNHFAEENFPGSVQTQVVAINNHGMTGGFYVDIAGTTHGFFNDNKHGAFNNIDAPNTNFNQILSINDLGELAGYSSTDPAGATLQQAFVRDRHGNFNYVPFNIPGIDNSQATGINDAEIVCGFYVVGNNNFGFLWSKRHNWIKTLSFPGAQSTQALGLNNAGEVVGSYTDTAGATHGFVYRQGHYTNVDEPNGIGTTTVNGVNDHGEIVGFYVDAAGNTVGLVGRSNRPLW